jgi:hypothetical protein
MTLLDFAGLFPEFRARSWDGWRAILARLTDAVREFYAIVGRGAGKSRIAALLACFFASREYARAPGESIYIGVFAPDRRQAAITFRYVLGLLRSAPALDRLIVNETRDSVELSNGVIVEVITATLAAPRWRRRAGAPTRSASWRRRRSCRPIRARIQMWNSCARSGRRLRASRGRCSRSCRPPTRGEACAGARTSGSTITRTGTWCSCRPTPSA